MVYTIFYYAGPILVVCGLAHLLHRARGKKG